MGTPKIFLGGQLCNWVYDSDADTHKPPIRILGLFGSGFRWLQRHKPDGRNEYAFHYSFPAHHEHCVERFQPPPQNLPVMEDIDIFLNTHSWDTAIHLTIEQLNELHYAVTRNHPQPLARMCKP